MEIRINWYSLGVYTVIGALMGGIFSEQIPSIVGFVLIGIGVIGLEYLAKKDGREEGVNLAVTHAFDTAYSHIMGSILNSLHEKKTVDEQGNWIVNMGKPEEEDGNEVFNDAFIMDLIHNIGDIEEEEE